MNKLYMYDEHGEEVGASLKVADKIYFWNVEAADNVG